MRRSDMDDDHEIVFRETGHGTRAFLAGLAIGAVAALLLAPMSGAETRREIRKRADKARRRALRAAEEIGDTVTERFNTAKEFVAEEIETAKDKLESTKRQVGRAVEAGREAARETREELSRRVAETKAAYDAGVETARTVRRSAASASEDARTAD
jgi:gas vesicle protein